VQLAARRPKATRELKFRPRKKLDFKARGIAIPPWMASDLLNPLSLTHAGVARGPS